MKLPIIIMLALMPLVLTAYAEEPSHVDVYDYPFNITLLEGGNFTLYNNATNNIYFDGAFEGMVYCGSISGNPDCDGFDNSKTFELPANVFTPDTYYLNDKTYLDTNLISTITIVKPQVNFGSTSSETVGTFEPISNSTFVDPPAPVINPPVYVEPIDDDEPTDMTAYNDLMVMPPDVPYCDNDPEWCDYLKSLEDSEPVKPESTSDTEVLNLRLEILKVIESIFRLVLQ